MLGKLRPFLIGFLLVLVLALTPFRLLKISGRSMEPTLRNGETYLLDQFYWKPGGLHRDDIVVLNHGEERWVKRLIGMPGDRLEIHTLGDWITKVNNITANPSLHASGRGVEERTVDADEIYVIGDNMNRSADSTNQEHGSFKLADVIGIVRNFALKREFSFPEHSRQVGERPPGSF